MQTLFILTRDPDDTIQTIMAEIGKGSEVITINLPEVQDFDSLVDAIESCNKVITW